jgi:hypothetical protein
MTPIPETRKRNRSTLVIRCDRLNSSSRASETSEFVKESDRRFQIANREFINAFEIRLYIHSQFGMCHLESISSHPLRPGIGKPKSCTTS